MLYHTQTPNRVCGCTFMKLLLRFVLTAKNVNNASLVHLSDAYIGEMLGNVSFCRPTLVLVKQKL